MRACITTFFAVFSLLMLPLPAHASSVFMEDMTWMEIRDRLAAGATIAIVPTGGTEQNGPQMITGKHNYIARYTAGEIAKRLKNAMVAPVVAYVPEGRITPPEGHMQFAGTFSVAPEVFALVLEDIAASLKQHGFRTICFVGEHGGNQEIQRQVAGKLNAKWSSSGVRVVHVADYYNDNNGQKQWAQSIGVKVMNPEAHAGFFDTSELLAVRPSGVDSSKFGVRTERHFQSTGSMGDSTRASAQYGHRLLSLKVEAAVAQIQKASSGER
ncbi:MAG: creatininase family protein [Rickettsiales bacterium]